MIDFKKTFLLILPIRLRKANLLLAILNSVGSVLNSLFVKYKSWLQVKHYEISITPQVCSIERMLNDEYDREHIRKYLSEPSRLTTNFFYRETDNKDWYLVNGKYITDDTRFNYPYDFIINIPLDIIIEKERLTALVNKYKLLGKTYRIIRHG